MNGEKKQISFRQRALEYVNRPVLLDDTLQIISIKNWLSLAILLLAIAAFLAWLIWGKLFIQVTGSGVLLSTSNDIITRQSPQQDGVISKIFVKPGQKITNKTVLIEMNNDLDLQLKLKKTFLDQLKSQQRDLSQRSKYIVSQLEISEKKQIEQINASLDAAKEKLKQLDTMLVLKESAFKKGVIDLPNLTESRIEYYKLLQEIGAHKAELIAKQANLMDLRDKWRERERDLSLMVNQAQYDFDLIQRRWEQSRMIVSNTAGIVAEIRTSVGDHVKAGDPLVTIIPVQQQLYALVFVPATKGKLIKAGMPAQIALTMINKLEYGTIKGRVESISLLPTTPENMMTLLKNQELIRFFDTKVPVFSVKIRLEKNSASPSGYQWSNSEGPDIQLTQGTLIEGMINVSTKRPIDLLINYSK